MTDPRSVLIQALEDVQEAEVPDDLREVAFSKAFDLRAGTAAPPPPADPKGAAVPSRTTEEDKSDDLLTRMASRLGIAAETVGEVFDTDGGQVTLVIGPGKLPNAAASATKELALLVAAGRQGGGVEEWTSLDEVRTVAADFKKLDSPNFAKTVKEMDDVFQFRTQSARKTSVRLARPGWEQAASLIRRLGGES